MSESRPEIVINKEELKNYINNLKDKNKKIKEISFYVYTIIPFFFIFFAILAIIMIIALIILIIVSLILSIIWLFTGGILSALHKLFLTIRGKNNNDE